MTDVGEEWQLVGRRKGKENQRRLKGLQHLLVFDPIFSRGEKTVLRKLGLNVLSENEEGKHLATKPTIFYLMHCGKALYNNILWNNWKIIMLTFGQLSTNRSFDREFQCDYSYMNQALDVCEEKQLPCPTRFSDVFGDTATITFPLGNLSKLPPSTWTEPQEQEYQHCPDLEIILKKIQM
uniref:SRR1-like domain-containing protein n=1 Tax=Cynoglossus semilaevis TaxID=244447 RepID=A0A3P8VYK4_CYNSE